MLAALLSTPKSPEISNGLTLERYGKLQTAELAYLESLRNEAVMDSRQLLTVVQERWKECAYNMKKWKLLFEFGKMNHDIWLLLDCYGKCNIWE